MTLLAVACIPPVWKCIEGAFHPEDLMAMGFALAALACARRGSWIFAGVLVALAVLTQQFTILVAVPLLALAPSSRRFIYAGAAVVTAIIASAPLIALTSRDVAYNALVGSGNSMPTGGTAVWELHLHGAPLVVVSRLMPIALSFVLAVLVVRKLGHTAMEPVPLMALIVVSLGLRLVFEFSLFWYYFMPLVVTLLLLEVARGHTRPSLLLWFGAVTVASLPLDLIDLPLIGAPYRVVPFLLVAVAIVLIALRVVRDGSIWFFVGGLALMAAALVEWRLSGRPLDLSHPLPTWFWQLIFVPWGIALAAVPLLSQVRHHHVPPWAGNMQMLPVVDSSISGEGGPLCPPAAPPPLP